MTIITPLLVGLGIPYVCGLLALLLGLRRTRDPRSTEMPFVSVVVAARNEEDQIEGCLAALAGQDYGQDRYEIIVVDDRSTDGTAEVISRWTARTSTVHSLRVGEEPSPLVGKKRALDLGIRQAKGEIILTTDADCRPKPTWISTMVRYFEPQVSLVAGYSYTEQPGEEASFLQRLRSLERIAVAAVSAGSIGLGKGLTCTGQNLAYRRETFYKIGGFAGIGHLRSGDDDLLMQRMSRSEARRMRYAFLPETHVRTVAPPGAGKLIDQEKRRASKGLLYPAWLTVMLAATYLFYAVLLLSVVLSIFVWKHYHVAWIMLGLKALAEFALVLRMCSLLQRRDLIPWFPWAEVLHLPYVLVFGLWGTVGTYRWK